MNKFSSVINRDTEKYKPIGNFRWRQMHWWNSFLHRWLHTQSNTITL